MKKNYTSTSNESDSPEQILIRYEQSEFLYILLENLDEEDRVIIIGLYSELKTLKQLGNELKISPAAVRKRKLKIIKKCIKIF
ncbi:sigma-70 family RNA polymerase sigma factor [Enterococcus faecalis]|nr:sigma-70 family RNA polymerase sigma factor [Enterococcus faecalis]